MKKSTKRSMEKKPHRNVKKDILDKWERLQSTPFPNQPTSPKLVEIRADLANISTFGSGCVNTFLQKGQLGPGHHTILLNCLDALQKLDGKIALVCSSDGGCDPEEIRELNAYKTSLERLLEVTLIGCGGVESENGS